MANRSCRPALAVACLLLALFTSGAGIRTAEAAEEIAVRTIYLTHPVGTIHRVSIRGTLGGAGRVQLDANRCGLNLFGDTTICTTDPAPEIPVRLEQLQVKDIKGEGRRVFRLEGDLRPAGHRYYLVVPRGRTGNYRLAIVTAEGRVRVLSLEEDVDGAGAPLAREPDAARSAPAPAPDPRPRGAPEAPPDAAGAVALGRAVYSAVQEGNVVTLRARGEHPGPGHGARLERTVQNLQPPAYRLVVEAPPGRPPAASGTAVPFSVSATFDASALVSYVFVEDADGKHRIPVQRLRR